jgi:hypothetical protein
VSSMAMTEAGFAATGRQFASDSPLEEAGFEPSVPRAAGAIETRALRRMLSDSKVDSKVKGRDYLEGKRIP